MTDDDKRAESKSLLILHIVNNALIIKGVRMYLGFEARPLKKKTKLSQKYCYIFNRNSLVNARSHPFL